MRGKLERVKRTAALLMAGVMMLALAGCADNPEKSVVREKNMDKMLEEAEKTDDKSSYEQVKEEMKNYETYKTQIKDERLKVTVNVDAKVEVPEVEKLSVYRVSAKKIKQKFLDNVREKMTPGVTYYDGSKESPRTKPVIAKDIKESEKEMADYKKAGDDGMADEVARRIESLKEEYEGAPDSVELTDFPMEKIQKIKKLFDSNPTDHFYSWLHDLHDNGEVFYGVSDGKDGNYHSLFMQNSENYGNCLRYECSKNGYAETITYAAVGTDLPMIVEREKDKVPDFAKAGMEIADTMTTEEVENEPLTLSIEEAEEKANAFLSQMGLDDYECFDKGMYAQLLQDRAMADGSGALYYRNIYRFLCLRKLDNVFVNNQAGFKLTDSWQDNDYVKKMWESEVVALGVNDSGVVDFYYLSPLSIDETVVEKSNIKSFAEIKDTFEQMVVVENAVESDDGEEHERVSIEVTDVRLVYTRISEKDSFDTGLVVPVWDFEGTIVDEYAMKTGNAKTGNILSINAIDGSVINRELGY